MKRKFQLFVVWMVGCGLAYAACGVAMIFGYVSSPGEGILAFFTGIALASIGLICYWVEFVLPKRRTKTGEPGEDSYLHPDNLPTGRYKPGSFD